MYLQVHFFNQAGEEVGKPYNFSWKTVGASGATDRQVAMADFRRVLVEAATFKFHDTHTGWWSEPYNDDTSAIPELHEYKRHQQ